MTCKHTRTVSVFMKHNDLAHIKIPHIKFEHEGYLPRIGPFGGDDTNFVVCLDCHIVVGWPDLTDDDLKEALADYIEEDDQEEEAAEYRAEQKRLADVPAALPAVSQLQSVRQQLREMIIEDYGINWSTRRDAIDTLTEIAQYDLNTHYRIAAKEMISGARVSRQ